MVGRDFLQLLQANTGIKLSQIRDIFRWRSSQFIIQKSPSHFLRLSINRLLLCHSAMFPEHHKFFILHWSPYRLRQLRSFVTKPKNECIKETKYKVTSYTSTFERITVCWQYRSHSFQNTSLNDYALSSRQQQSLKYRSPCPYNDCLSYTYNLLIKLCTRCAKHILIPN